MEEKKMRKGITFKRLLGPLLIILMAAIVLMTFINAALRYTMGKNILSFEEYSRFCFVWICYIGTVIAFEEKRHICVDLISGHLKGKAKTTVDLICQIPIQCYSLQHHILLSSPDTSSTKLHISFGPDTSFILGLLVTLVHSSTVAYQTPSDLGDSSFGVTSF